jgi:hypothetical protein
MMHGWGLDLVVRGAVRFRLTAMTAGFCLLVATEADAAQLRSVRRGASRAARAEIARIFRRDWLRDSRLPVRALTKGRTVFRYLSRSRSTREIARGIRVGTHTTSRANAGRPLASVRATRRYGLPSPASTKDGLVRETIRLSRGLKVRIGRAIGGSRGVGEITLVKPLKPGAIKRVVPLR